MRATRRARRTRRGGGAHVVMMGVGNIGSHTVSHIARTAGVGRVTVVDPDVFDRTNVATQDIGESMVGQSKAAAQAARITAVDPALEVVALEARLEDVPLGLLRGDVLLSAPDGRAARVAASRVAWHLGMPWVDAGVEASGRLARVTVRVPSEQTGCAECAFGPADYEALSWEYGCAANAARPTGAPSWLGGLAAALQAAECGRLLSGEAPRAAGGWQWTLGAEGATSMVTTFRRNPACRFDHQKLQIERLAKSPLEMPVAEALRLGCAGTSPELRLVGHSFVTRLVCAQCGAPHSCVYVARRLDAAAKTCASCGALMTPSGFDDRDFLDETMAASAGADRAMSTFGFRPGDVFAAGTRHFELGGAA